MSISSKTGSPTELYIKLSMNLYYYEYEYCKKKKRNNDDYVHKWIFSLFVFILERKKSLYKIHNECISLSSCLLLRSISVTTYKECT